MKGHGRKSSTRRDLDEIIQTCDSIESRKFNPFLLNVSEALSILRHHSEHLGTLEDHLLDMRTITAIARVVGLQSAHVRFQSSTLFVDPETVKQKTAALSRQQLAEFLLLSWHPVVELEQVTPASVKEAHSYWQQLLSFFERRRRFETGPFTAPSATELNELAKTGLVETQAFNKRLLEIWDELKRKAGPDSSIEYWSFVKGSNFPETVIRAQFVSFLVTYGYANMRKNRDTIILRPKKEPASPSHGSPLSLPISIPSEAS